MYQKLIRFLWLFLTALGSVSAADPLPTDFTLARSTLPIALVPSANHYPMRVGIVPGLPGFDFAGLQVASDASWVSGAIDAGSGELVLTFATGSLLNASSTATLTLSNAAISRSLSITATLAPLNLLTLQDDPARSRMYGLHQNGAGQGCVVVIDPLTGQTLGTVSVGNKAADLAVRADGQELLVLCTASRDIQIVDTTTLAVTGRIPLPAFDAWGTDIPAGDIAYGPANTIYYVDGSWAPVLRVLNRGTGQVVQTLVANGTNSSSEYGFGDIGIDRAQTALYAWVQYGWSAGYAGSYIVRHNINADGTLSYVGKNNASYPEYSRDPLNTPVLVSQDGTTVIAKTLAVDAAAITTTRRTFTTPVFAMTPNAEVASTATELRELATGNLLYTHASNSSVQAVTSDYARLVYFNAVTRTIGTVNLLQVVGAEALGRNLSPADGSVVTAPSELSWSSVPGVDRYRIYLGTSAAAVSAATSASAEYLGEVQGVRLVLTQALAAGITYYWRIDAVTDSEISAGEVRSFTVSSLSISTSKITAATVKGHTNLARTVSLDSITAGEAWSVSSPDSWISFVASSGITPATVQIRLDTTTLAAGLHRSKIIVTGASGPVEVPLELQVDPLAVTALRSRPGTTHVYAISEAASGSTTLRAYLIELDTLQKSISRVVPVGRGVTDLAVHEADQRVYVTNWDTGALLAVSLNTFTIIRSYAFDLPSAGNRDVYRISPAGAGRLIYEPQDQWIYIGLLDTNAGATVATTFQREGGGVTSPDGRYYYHGDNNISDAGIAKLDTVGNVFSEVATNSTKGLGYYGSRTVIASEDGNRIFYNGLVYASNLSLEWNSGTLIYAASADGRFAFGDNGVFDVPAQRKVATLPATSTVSAFNAATGRLVIPQSTGFLYYSLAETGLTGAGSTPENNAVVYAPEVLSWASMPAATAYRVYLGTSQAAVAAATPASPEYLGQVTAPLLAMNQLLAPGLVYYWRVDYVVGTAVAAGPVQSFRVVTVAPSRVRFDLGTVQGDIGYPIEIGLSSAVDGETWSATASAPWIELEASSGTTPATLRAMIRVDLLPAGLSAGQITLSHGAESYTIPVSMTLDPMAIKYFETSPDSALVYAISETTTSDGASRAYLLEIDTALEAITGVVRVGTGVTDLAVHRGDNRIYVINWLLGALYAVNRDTFAVDRIYDVPGFAGVGYSDSDVYVISAGGPGRLVIEAMDQWIDVSIFSTVTGAVLASTFERQGGGAHDATGRYYYHGDDNSSGAEIHKFDTVGDTFQELAHVRVSSAGYYGSRVVTVSANGSRIFWNGSVFDANLTPLWTFGQIVYATTPDGRFAFGETSIFDTVAQQTVLGMPATTKVSAYNSTSDKLVVQTAEGLRFFTLGNGAALPAPVLQAGAATASSMPLTWTEKSLETSFTLQRRVSGAADWIDVSSTLAQNSTAITVGSLSSGTTYEFRIKANGTAVTSPWSNIVAAATLAAPLPVPQVNNSSSTTTTITLGWSLTGNGFTQVVVERAISPFTAWLEVARLGATALQFTDTGLSSGTTYAYRLKTENATASSTYSSSVQVQTTIPVVAVAPTLFTAQPCAVDALRLTWVAHPSAAGHKIERTDNGGSTWNEIANIPSGVNFFVDQGLGASAHAYRIRAYNDSSTSANSPELPGLTAPVFSRLADEFTGTYNITAWQSVQGASVQNVTTATGFGGSEVLRFHQSGTRQASTQPLDVSSGGRVAFKFRAGDATLDGSTYWETCDTGENVVLEYSTNGTSWTTLQTLVTTASTGKIWAEYSIDLPAAAQSATTAFRWRQLSHSGTSTDIWALESVLVTAVAIPPVAPDFISTSTIGDTSVAIIWSGSPGAVSYRVERTSDGLVWTTLATRASSTLYYTDNSCTADTWYAYRIRAANAIGLSAPSAIAWARTFSQMDFWRLNQYGTVAAVGAAAPLARDVDQHTNLEKFAFGLPVGQTASTYVRGSDQPGLPAVWVDPLTHRLCIEFLRRKQSSKPGLRYEVEFSNDLLTWTAGGVLKEQTSLNSLWERACLEDGQSLADENPRRYVRVKLTQE